MSMSTKTTSRQTPSGSGSLGLEPMSSTNEPQPTHTSPSPGRNLPLKINGLYILLSTQEVANKFHWGLYLHRGSSQGWIFNITRSTNSWLYDHHTSDSVIYSNEFVTALKVADVDPDLHEALRDRLAQVPLEENTRWYGKLTCRTWLLGALDELDNEGYISIKRGKTAAEFETEARDLATRAVATEVPQVRKSHYALF